jgi:serine/threonine-protein kinase
MADGGATPRIVGRYALFDAIASGGMASVHLGRLMGPVGFSRTVAIKRLHESFATNPEFVAMFMDEARLAARIRHANVVATVDVVAQDRELLLVMEYISGESLSLLLKRARAESKPTPIPVVVDIVVNALNGLHAAHEATNEKGEPLDIVHRDVSPQNILVGTDGVARVLDFGVAKAVGRMHETRTGQLKGKIRYMAPEQITGRGVTRTADIYAAAVVLWEAVAGQRLVTGETDAEVMFRVLEGRVEPPSRVRPDVPRALDEIIVRGLQPKPGDRFATAQEMANALVSAVPAVPRSAVAAWVADNAGEAIQQRKDHVAVVESTGTRATSALTEKAELAELSASLTAPSVERPITGSFALWKGSGALRGRLAVLAGVAAALLVALLATVFSYDSQKKTAAAPAVTPSASATPPPLETAIVLNPPAQTATAVADTGPGAEADGGGGAVRKRAPPVLVPPPNSRPVAPKGTPADRLYRRD